MPGKIAKSMAFTDLGHRPHEQGPPLRRRIGHAAEAVSERIVTAEPRRDDAKECGAFEHRIPQSSETGLSGRISHSRPAGGSPSFHPAGGMPRPEAIDPALKQLIPEAGSSTPISR
jgi:hypothetical protein